MLSCKDASRLQSQSQDRHLSLAERFGLRLHLLICSNCRRFKAQLQLIRRASRRIDETEGIGAKGDGLSPDAKARILKELSSKQDDRQD